MSDNKRVVALENGEVVDFGVRANLITSFDTATNEVVFKLFSGEVIVWDASKIEGLEVDSLNELAKTIILYGLLAKIKTNLAAIKLYEDGEDGEQVHSLANNINGQIKTINSGRFNIRATASTVAGLTLDQRAFATAVSKHDKFAEAVSVKPEVASKWVDLEDEDVIAEIISVWDTYTVSNKNTIRKQPYFRLEKVNLELA